MSHNAIQIKEGAFIVSDAHYSELRPEFLEFIINIRFKKLQPTQLIFMGDIFDTLFGQIPYTHAINEELITLLNEISLEIELIYLEGNHDFNLASIFPHAKVFSIAQQPLECSYKEKKVYLAHGDFASDFGYRLYTSVIRNPLTLYILGFLDFISSHAIIKKLDDYLSKKDDCKEFVGFEDFVSKRLLDKYECDYFIEGHFHQNKQIKYNNFVYINLGVFACNQRYFIVKSSKDKALLEENMFSKEI
jgi:UDP-2,3-diacylglucosamine hydrolase